MKETDIQKACLEYLKLRGIFVWRNNTTGIFDSKTGQWRFHGMRGVADILGVLPQTVNVDGQSVTFGNLLAVEVKRPGNGHVSDHQQQFLDEVNKRGGVGFVVTSVSELESKLTEFV